MTPPPAQPSEPQLPLAGCPVPIYLVPREVAVKTACEALMAEAILGFDTETKPAFKPGQKYSPSLIQIAGKCGVYVFQLPLIRDLSPIKSLLLSPSIKVGVGIAEDLRRLSPLIHLDRTRQFEDIGPIAKQKGIAQGSLRGLTAELLKKRLSKSAQLTNWAREQLTHAQLKYAATDAWVSREIYLKLKVL